MSVPVRAEGVLLDRAVPCAFDALVAPSGAVLVIAPHPDDETLGCGLAIRAALEAGRNVGVLLLTGGGASHPASRSHPPEAMKALRRAEFEAALDALGGGLPAGSGRIVHRLLDLPDGAVRSDAAGSDGALDAARAMAEALDARTLWVTWGGDPHADHGAAATLADRLCGQRRFARRLDYAVWGRFGSAGRALDEEPGGARAIRFDAPRHRCAKRRAMDAYRSQLTPMIEDDPDGFVMPAALVEHFAEAPEVFVDRRTADPSTASGPRRP